jgi:hypothetical protein
VRWSATLAIVALMSLALPLRPAAADGQQNGQGENDDEDDGGYQLVPGFVYGAPAPPPVIYYQPPVYVAPPPPVLYPAPAPYYYGPPGVNLRITIPFN